MTPDARGTFWVWLVWALKPGEARLAGVFTAEDVADRYLISLPTIYAGFKLAKEKAPLDHAFRLNDGYQALAYGDGRRRGGG